MDDLENELSKLESIVDGLEKPRELDFGLLRAITDKFSNARIIGHGGCGDVYKGIIRNRTVAVKKLSNTRTIDNNMFHREVNSMMMVNHNNIVRFLGYCSVTKEQAIQMEKSFVMAEIRERLLCFEFIKNGSIKKQIKDELRGLKWHERYQIIEGICEGLHYLHNEKCILHMDLKPDNILLGDNMVPKIIDFGLARLNDKTQTTSEQRLLTPGYCALEYLIHGKFSVKSDIYSLGVIIVELVTGSKEDPNITKVLRRWRHRWNKSSGYAPLLWYRQVSKCLDLAQWCMQDKPTCRPYISDIISELKEIDRWNGETKYAAVPTLEELTSNLEDMLGIEPLEMHIPFALKEQIQSIKVTNGTDDHFALKIATPSPLPFSTQPEECIVPPRSQLCVTIALKAQEKALLQNHCYDFSVQSSRIDGIPISMDLTCDMFDEMVGKVVDEVNVTVVFDKPPTPEHPDMDIDSIKHQEANNKAPVGMHLRANKESVGPSYQVYKGSETIAPTVPDDSSNMLVSAAIAKITNVLGDKFMDSVNTKLSEKIPELRTLPTNLENVRKDLRMMSNVIKDLDTANLGMEMAQGWVGELRRVAFRVEDVMDKYSYRSAQLKEESSIMRFLKGAHYAKAFSDIAEEVVQIMIEIKKVKDLQSSWLPIVDEHFPKDLVSFDRRWSQGFFRVLVQEEDLVGIKENQRKLVQWLEPNEPNSTVITVSGMGGLGKSTLVANVVDWVKDNFGAYAWISVSQTYTIDALLMEVLRKISYTEKPLSISMDKMSTFGLKAQIWSRLMSVNCLVVFDDVWDKEVYEQMQDVFNNIESASRFIITTRRDDIASLASFGNHLQLQPLDKNDALHLFYARAFGNTVDRKCPGDLEKVAEKIVERCQGLPQALVTMGNLMSIKPQTEHAWNQVLKQFQSELSKKDDVQAILKLSYNDLTWNLRNCFLYCSLFPEDYTISRETLVRLWVAEGFAVATDDKTMEDVAELNLMELINRNMLQVVDYDELGRVSTCKMHDIVRDLALSIAKMEKFGSAIHRGAMLLMEKDVRRLSSYGWKDSDSLTEGFPSLRTLMSFGAVTSTPQMLASIFSCSCYLTVLELQDSAITEVPQSIQNLFNLRYIGLRRTRIKSLPECVEKLSNLQTLDIKQTKIEKLPRGIVKVKKLRHLLADRTIDEKQRSFQYFLGVKPPKDLSNLVELQTLETVEASDGLADQLEKMKMLQSVWIGNVNASHSAKLFASLSKMPLLSSLLLNACDVEQALSLETFKPESRQLHRLIVRGRWAAGMLQCPIFQFDGHGKNLRYLALSWSGLVQDPLLLLAPHVPNLVYLSLNRASSVGTLVVSDGSFPKLRILVLKNLPNVNQITIGKGSLQNIQGLYVVALPMLDKVPEDIESLTSLKKLRMLQLHGNFKIQWGVKGMTMKMAHVLEVRL